ncbi:MAG: hypothetical protein ACLP01_24285 [Solirubrobacteraceae bacterium]
MQVAAALQTQVVRDFAPLWGVSAVISPFASLEDVPAGYIPIAIVSRDLTGHWSAFHFTLGGSPFALVQCQADWSLAASHEMLEILCDPTGQVTAVAPSLADRRRDALDKVHRADAVVDGKSDYEPQGQVEYLLEICDPCEASTYRINGVLVADFVTPKYYEASPTEAARYSFTGRIRSPLTLLAGGYISWRTSLPGTAIFQAQALSVGKSPDVLTNALASQDQPAVAPEDLMIRELPDVPSRLSREWVDSVTTTPFVFKTGSPPLYAAPSGEWATAFRKEVSALLGTQTHGQGPPSLDTVIEFIQYLATQNGNDAFRKDAAKRKEQLATLNLPATPSKLSDVGEVDIPEPAKYEDLLERLRKQKNAAGLFGPDLFDPDMALWMCMLFG